MREDILHTADENSPYWGIAPTDRFLFLDGVTHYIDLGLNVAGQLWGFWLNHAKDWSMSFTIKNYYHPFYNGFFWLTEDSTSLSDRTSKKNLWVGSNYVLTNDVGTFLGNSGNSFLAMDLLNYTNKSALQQYFLTYKASEKKFDLYVNGQHLRKMNYFETIWNNHTATSFVEALVTIGYASAGAPVSQSFLRMDLGQFLVANVYVNEPKLVREFFHARFDRNKYPAVIKNNRLVDLAINTQTPASGLVIPDLMGNCTATIVNQTTPDYRLYY
jgi:hypothetical protein